MRLVRTTFLVMLAVIITAVPIVHSHPLLSRSQNEANELTSQNVCAICAVGTDGIVVDTPAVVAPETVVGHLVVATVIAAPFDAPLPTPSRAPPVA